MNSKKTNCITHSVICPGECALTKTGPVVRMEVIAMATLASEAQPVIVGTMAQYTNVLAATVVSAARVHDCRTK